MAKTKMNIQLENSLKDYVEEQSERLGVSQNGFINLCIAQHKEQRESISAMNNIKTAIYKLEEMQKKNK